MSFGAARCHLRSLVNPSRAWATDMHTISASVTSAWRPGRSGADSSEGTMWSVRTT